MGNFSTLHIARSGILANQRAMEVTGHNIANVNTEGYSRQRAVFKTALTCRQPSLNTCLNSGTLGTGVVIEGVERIRDNYLERQAAANDSDCGYWRINTDLLQRAELAFAEPNDYSLQESLDAFFSVWQDLNQNPCDPGARASVRGTAETLVDRLKMSYEQLSWTVDEARSRLFEEDSGLVNNANMLVRDIAYYNHEISRLLNSGSSPNDLMDRRDMMVEELSGIADIIFEKNMDGTADVLMRIDDEYKGGGSLVPGADQDVVEKNGEYYLYVVRGASAKTINSSEADYETMLTDGDSDTGRFLTVSDADDTGNPVEYKISLKSGSIAGVMDADIKVRDYMESLDKLAYKLVEVINAAHEEGYTLNYETAAELKQGECFFTPWADIDASITGIDQCQGAASLISIHSDIHEDLNNIAASGNKLNPEDGVNAMKIGQLGETLIADLNDSTLPGYYRSIVTTVGLDLNGAQDRLDVKEGAREQIDMLRQSISGVNLDEEMTNMIMFQRAYQASSRVIVTVDRMLEELINLVR